jgi:hypothetical protein
MILRRNLKDVGANLPGERQHSKFPRSITQKLRIAADISNKHSQTADVG